VQDLIAQIESFVEERNWKKFHNPKDIAESICIEAAELLQLFQWIKPKESREFKNIPSKMQRIEEELADVVIYCLSIANTLDIDLTRAILNKLAQNKEKYQLADTRENPISSHASQDLRAHHA